MPEPRGLARTDLHRQPLVDRLKANEALLLSIDEQIISVGLKSLYDSQATFLQARADWRAAVGPWKQARRRLLRLQHRILVHLPKPDCASARRDPVRLLTLAQETAGMDKPARALERAQAQETAAREAHSQALEALRKARLHWDLNWHLLKRCSLRLFDFHERDEDLVSLFIPIEPRYPPKPRRIARADPNRMPGARQS